MSREHAYAYEAGYRDGSVHYELEHCPACKNVADLQEALVENATLRQQLADVTESMGRVEERCAKLREERDMYRDLVGMMDHPDINAQLNTENAKLREKIKALTELASIGKLTASQCTELAEDNARLRELVRVLVCATDPHDRERLIINAAELLGEVTT